jgi:FMN-dependent NADH-azoreductase
MIFISETSLEAVGMSVGDRNKEQAKNQTAHLTDTLIKEFQDADTIIIGTPVYNFGPPVYACQCI